ncbi:Iron-Sulfur binding protein [Gracilaria domingensis]|nr:Iron-Sulfur binding protein [Gracilaria domingensis]
MNLNTAQRGLSSLENGTWFKLICGASYHDTPSIRNPCEVYTIAGVDCIDVAADESIIRAAREGIQSGVTRALSYEKPLLMISINDDSDPHFRKAVFEVKDCISGCPRPCQKVCPADAIDLTGAITDRCYGCGRCIPACPINIVHAEEYVHALPYVKTLLSGGIDCLEIHTGKGHLEQFEVTWKGIEDAVVDNLKMVAVSFPDLGTDEEMESALRHMWNVISKSKRFLEGGLALVWQTDGRPMSGDISRGTAIKSVKLAKRVIRLLKGGSIPGHVQLAGGTNASTVARMRAAGLLRSSAGEHGMQSSMHTASGIAVGGYARKIVKEKLGNKFDTVLSEPELEEAVKVASELVLGLKSRCEE